MVGIQFGDFHTYNDFNLILNSKTIGAPQPKVTRIDIPGADGYLDTTEYFGEPKYYNRNLIFNFSTIIPQGEFYEQYSVLADALHGKLHEIILDSEQDFAYVGRCYISDFTQEKSIGKITITCDCDPYKYKRKPTYVTTQVSGTKTRIISNLRKTVTPLITTDSAVAITFNGNTYNLASAGSYSVPGIALAAGNNELTFAGDAVVTLKYREGRL